MNHGEQAIRDRLEKFARNQRGRGWPISIKVRSPDGCFHREHSPHAYAEIDEFLASIPKRSRPFVFEEHETGPEVLVWVTAATAGVTFTTAAINIVTAIINARAKGRAKGDQPDSDLELIVRRSSGNGNGITEEKVLRVRSRDGVQRAEVERKLIDVIDRLLADTEAKPTPSKKKRTTRKSPAKKASAQQKTKRSPKKG